MNGLAETPKGTTSAPGMYEEIEQGDEVAKGHVQVKEIIAYDFIERKKVIERDKIGNEIGSKWVIIEKGRPPYFCQTKEQELIFLENNPGIREEDSNKVVIAASGVRTESYSIQLLKSTAIKYINDPRNVKEFTRPENETLIDALGGTEPTWRQQAKQLGIPLNKETGGSRKKEDVLTDIVAALTQTTTSIS
jgi:hypothetical protein